MPGKYRLACGLEFAIKRAPLMAAGSDAIIEALMAMPEAKASPLERALHRRRLLAAILFVCADPPEIAARAGLEDMNVLPLDDILRDAFGEAMLTPPKPEAPAT
jgi:hypothetical protein